MNLLIHLELWPSRTGHLHENPWTPWGESWPGFWDGYHSPGTQTTKQRELDKAVFILGKVAGGNEVAGPEAEEREDPQNLQDLEAQAGGSLEAVMWVKTLLGPPIQGPFYRDYHRKASLQGPYQENPTVSLSPTPGVKGKGEDKVGELHSNFGWQIDGKRLLLETSAKVYLHLKLLFTVKHGEADCIYTKWWFLFPERHHDSEEKFTRNASCFKLQFHSSPLSCHCPTLPHFKQKTENLSRNG